MPFARSRPAGLFGLSLFAVSASVSLLACEAAPPREAREPRSPPPNVAVMSGLTPDRTEIDVRADRPRLRDERRPRDAEPAQRAKAAPSPDELGGARGAYADDVRARLTQLELRASDVTSRAGAAGAAARLAVQSDQKSFERTRDRILERVGVLGTVAIDRYSAEKEAIEQQLVEADMKVTTMAAELP